MVATLGSMGMAIIYGLKVNLSVALVAMVNHTAIAEGTWTNSTVDEESVEAGDGPFPWGTREQGLVLGAYFLGYTLTQLPGGRAAEIYSGGRARHLVPLCMALLCGP